MGTWAGRRRLGRGRRKGDWAGRAPFCGNVGEKPTWAGIKTKDFLFESDPRTSPFKD